METFFRIATDRFELSMEGQEEFVRSQIRSLVPVLSREGTAKTAPAAARTSGGPAPGSLAAWHSETVPSGSPLTMQDTILVFGYYMKRVKEQHIFTPSDIKRSFREVNRRVPKSLLQILGTLKRDHGMLWSPEDKRGRYALTPKGIKYVERLLSIRDWEGEAAGPEEEARDAGERTVEFSEIEKAPALRGDENGGPRSPSEKWSLLFKAQNRSRSE